MKSVATLSGPDLDYWVARAEGYGFLKWENGRVWDHAFGSQPIVYAPSVDPRHAVRIIEREGIAVGPAEEAGQWWAYCKDARYKHYGSSFCEAAMRCYVAGHFGDTVADEYMTLINPAHAGRYFGTTG